MYEIVALPGDGIGKEVTNEALKVLEGVGKKFGHTFGIKEMPFGGQAIDKFGQPLPEETLKECKNAQGILMGSVGGPKYDKLPSEIRPEKGLLKLRKELGVFGNLRPVKINEFLMDESPLKKEIIKGVDLLIVRELTGGAYFGHKEKILKEGKYQAIDTISYDEDEIERIVKMAFSIAQKRRKNLVSVDKENVLETSKLWRQIVDGIAPQYPEVSVRHMYVDNCSMQVIINPKQFDVIVTENMFGDILSDLCGVISGSIGMLPSASLGPDNKGVYEPIHGSAPDIAGKDLANPIGAILSMAMMLDLSYDLQKEGNIVKKAVNQVLSEGYRTKDLSGNSPYTKCSKFGDLVYDHVTSS